MGLSEALQKKLFLKLQFEDFDAGKFVKLIVDKEEEKVNVALSVKHLPKESEVFLIDHAWTYRQREPEKMLRSNPKLVERMLNITRYPDKQELPVDPYAKKKLPLDIVL
jgi:tubulin--tyrosine ligase-like protein 12